MYYIQLFRKAEALEPTFSFFPQFNFEYLIWIALPKRSTNIAQSLSSSVCVSLSLSLASTHVSANIGK